MARARKPAAILTRQQVKDLSARLHAARTDPALHCPAAFTDPATGQPYRLEPKPRGRQRVLEKYGHVCEDVDGKLFVRVPLGAHGPDYFGIDPATGAVVCTLCQGKEVPG